MGNLPSQKTPELLRCCLRSSSQKSPDINGAIASLLSPEFSSQKPTVTNHRYCSSLSQPIVVANALFLRGSAPPVDVAGDRLKFTSGALFLNCRCR
nr:hypothetical protein Iba_scaffold10623CG0010 [Ipomoea batatas]